jgi:hypothetical protein
MRGLQGTGGREVLTVAERSDEMAAAAAPEAFITAFDAICRQAGWARATLCSSTEPMAAWVRRRFRSAPASMSRRGHIIVTTLRRRPLEQKADLVQEFGRAPRSMHQELHEPGAEV